MTAEALLLDPLVHLLGWALLHSLWQVTVLAVAEAGVLALLRRGSAALRYAVACGGLFLMAAIPAATGWRLAMAAGSPVVAPAGPPAVTGFQGYWLAAASPVLEPLLPWMVGGWLLGVSFLSARLAGGCLQVRRLRLENVAPAPERWRESCAGLIRRLGIRRPVRLLASTRLLVPMACGWLRPAVIVPVSALTSLPVAQVESVLAHELAHIRRHDYLFNLVQSVVEVLLFYHPGARWLSERVRAERENCCDDVAVATCGDVRVYARALAGLEELRAAVVPVPALAASGGSLLQRIRRLLAPAPAPAGEPGSQLAAALLTLSLVFLAGCSVAAHAEAAASRGGAAVLTSAAGFSPRDELRMEVACGDSGKLRRCVDAAGGLRLECVPASPLSMFFSPSAGRSDGVEERSVREAPASSPRGGARGGGAPGDSRGRVLRRQTVVRSKLPRCSGV